MQENPTHCPWYRMHNFSWFWIHASHFCLASEFSTPPAPLHVPLMLKRMISTLTHRLGKFTTSQTPTRKWWSWWRDESVFCTRLSTPTATFVSHYHRDILLIYIFMTLFSSLHCCYMLHSILSSLWLTISPNTALANYTMYEDFHGWKRNNNNT